MLTLQYLVEDIRMLVADLASVPRFWRALRRAWPYENHDERVANAAADLMMSAFDRVNVADDRAEAA